MTDTVDTRENAGCVLPAGQLLRRTCGPAQSLHFAFRLDKGTVIPQKTHPCNPIPLPRTLGSSNFYRSIPRGILAGGSVFDLLGGYFCAVLGDDIYVQGLLDLIFYLLKQQYPLFPFIVGHSPYQSHPPPPFRLRAPSLPGAVCCSALFPTRAMCGSRGTSAGFAGIE